MLVGLRFHVLFHSPPGVLFTFPSRYWFTIGHTGVFSLTRWFSLIHMGFHLPHATRDTASIFPLSTTGLEPSWVQLSTASSSFRIPSVLSHYPSCENNWFRLFPLRSPLLGESLLISLPPATKMFQFAGLAHACLYIQQAVLWGLPHSDISGSMLASSSPECIVGRHVLLRLCVPRYPP